MHNVLEKYGIAIDTEIANEEVWISYKDRQTNLVYGHNLERKYSTTDLNSMLQDIMQFCCMFLDMEVDSIQDFVTWLSDIGAIEDIDSEYEEWTHQYTQFTRLLWLFGSKEMFREIYNTLNEA